MGIGLLFFELMPIDCNFKVRKPCFCMFLCKNSRVKDRFLYLLCNNAFALR